MTQDILTLIAEARALSPSGIGVIQRLADALEAEQKRAEAYLSDPDFDQEFARVKAERDRYHAALVEIRDWMLNPEPVNWRTLDTILTRVLGETPNRPVRHEEWCHMVTGCTEPNHCTCEHDRTPARPDGSES